MNALLSNRDGFQMPDTHIRWRLRRIGEADKEE